MKKIKKNILFWTLPLISLSSLPLVAFSCKDKDLSKDEDLSKVGKLDHHDMTINEEFGFDKPEPIPLKEYSKVGKLLDRKFKYNSGNEYSYWDLMGACEATLISYSDGDTMNFSVKEQPKVLTLNNGIVVNKENFPSTFAVRISLIDTLEEHIPGGTVSPAEKALAQEDKAFAEQMLPVGSTVRVVPHDWKITKSYNRIVAHVFFGEHFEKNYSVELVANGYTLPRIGDDDKLQFLYSYNQAKKENIQGFLLPYFAYAFNDGIENKKGFYNPNRANQGKTFFKNVSEFNKMYITHGNLMPYLEYILDSKFSTMKSLKQKNTNKYSLFHHLLELNKEDAE